MHPEDPQFTETISQSTGGGSAIVGDDDGKKPLQPGDSIGRYRIRERVGEGGMGVVYAAEDPELGRVVAIKLLRPVQGDDADVQQRRMLREAQALARLSHRNLVMVFDVGSRHGRVWIAMEYVVGDTLEVWLARERPTWGEIVDVFIEAGRGLAAVHEAGLVHRDFKPGNVLVRPDGTVQVLDLGLAARAGEREDAAAMMRARAQPDLDAFAANLTKTGGLMGTPAYMAPEQFLLQPADGRADQFGFCVALYEALYGHRPFTGKDLAQLMANAIAGLKALPAEIPGLPLAVRQVIARGLSADPKDRFPDMEALVRALASTRSPAMKSSASGLGRFTLGMIVGGGVLAIGTAMLLTRDDDDNPVQPPAVASPQPASEAQAAPSERAPSPAVAPEDEDEDEPYIVEDPAAEPAAEPAPIEDDAAQDGGGVLPEPQTPSTLKGLPSLSDLDEPETKALDPVPAEPTKPTTSDPAPREPAAKPSEPAAKPSEPAPKPSEPAKADPPPSEPAAKPSEPTPPAE